MRVKRTVAWSVIAAFVLAIVGSILYQFSLLWKTEEFWGVVLFGGLVMIMMWAVKEVEKDDDDD